MAFFLFPSRLASLNINAKKVFSHSGEFRSKSSVSNVIINNRAKARGTIAVTPCSTIQTLRLTLCINNGVNRGGARRASTKSAWIATDRAYSRWFDRFAGQRGTVAAIIRQSG